MRRPMRLLGSAGCLLMLVLGSSCGGGIVPVVSRDISVKVTPASVTIPPGSTICLNAEQNYYTGGGFGTSIPVRFGWLAASH